MSGGTAAGVSAKSVAVCAALSMLGAAAHPWRCASGGQTDSKWRPFGGRGEGDGHDPHAAWAFGLMTACPSRTCWEAGPDEVKLLSFRDVRADIFAQRWTTSDRLMTPNAATLSIEANLCTLRIISQT